MMIKAIEKQNGSSTYCRSVYTFLLFTKLNFFVKYWVVSLLWVSNCSNHLKWEIILWWSYLQLIYLKSGN